MTDDSRVFCYDIRATHDRGRKLSGGAIFSNETRRARAFVRLAEIRAGWPRYRFALVARLHNGTEERVDA